VLVTWKTMAAHHVIFLVAQDMAVPDVFPTEVEGVVDDADGGASYGLMFVKRTTTTDVCGAQRDGHVITAGRCLEYRRAVEVQRPGRRRRCLPAGS